MLINDLKNDSRWNDYLNYKLQKEFVNNKEKLLLEDFIINKKYKEIVNVIINNNYNFSIPKKHIINKNSSNKKRVVYNLNENEMIILKYISYLLYDYDHLFSQNLYSFRSTKGVKSAITNINKIENLNKMYGYKVDIKNYFNSINTKILLENLKQDIKDKEMYKLLHNLLSNEYVIYENNKIIEEKGIMAGLPTSAFLANYYLKDIDSYFWNKKLVYFRYADDIIIFCNTKEDVEKYSTELKEMLKKYKLEINTRKEYFFDPYTKWEFLGFSFQNKKIDISENSIKKIKGKIRRSARGIRRWMLKKNVNYLSALKVMNKKFNKKFYGSDLKSELSWKYWFFPTITTDKSLKIIDKYMQENLRYIVTGKHNKKNFEKVPYETLKKTNYKSLVHEYYELLLNVENQI